MLQQKITIDFFYFPSNLRAKALKSLLRLKCPLSTVYVQCPLENWPFALQTKSTSLPVYEQIQFLDAMADHDDAEAS